MRVDGQRDVANYLGEMAPPVVYEIELYSDRDVLNCTVTEHLGRALVRYIEDSEQPVAFDKYVLDPTRVFFRVFGMSVWNPDFYPGLAKVFGPYLHSLDCYVQRTTGRVGVIIGTGPYYLLTKTITCSLHFNIFGEITDLQL